MNSILQIENTTLVCGSQRLTMIKTAGNGDAPKPAVFLFELFHSYHFDDAVILFIILSCIINRPNLCQSIIFNF